MLSGSLAAQNMQHLKAYVLGDARAMMQGATTEEVRLTGLNASRLQQVLDRLVKPRLVKVQILNDYRVELLNDPPTQGVAQVTIRFPNGFETPLSVALFYTENGAKTSVLYNALMSAWRLETLDKLGSSASMRDVLENRLACLTKDRPVLEEIGLKGFMDGSAGFVSWDRLKRDTEAALQHLREKS
jgi:hypothetical protein